MDDIARGVATDGSTIFVVGESKSFASAAGNVVGQNDLVLLNFGAGPTAAGVSVSGRVFTPNGRGLGNAQVILTNPNGNTSTVITSPFGYFRFESVSVGETYIFNVSSKRYQFAPQVVYVSDQLNELNFFAEF